MAEQASQTTTIAASPERVWAIAADFESYPEWAKDVKDVVVRARDGEGRRRRSGRAGADGRGPVRAEMFQGGVRHSLETRRRGDRSGGRSATRRHGPSVSGFGRNC